MNLILAKNKVEFAQLKDVVTPKATDTFTPIPHAHLVEQARVAVGRAGLTIEQEEHAIARDGLRYFGGFALTGDAIRGDDRRLVMGLRNSGDKSIAAAVCIGNQMMVCENLCFSSDVKLARRHTTNIFNDLPRVLAEAVGRCVSHWVDMGNRIQAYQEVELAEDRVADLLVQFADAKALPPREIYNVMGQFREPNHPEFKGRTAWSLYNGVTECLKGGDLGKLPQRTMAVQSILDKIAGHAPAIEVVEAN